LRSASNRAGGAAARCSGRRLWQRKAMSRVDERRRGRTCNVVDEHQQGDEDSQSPGYWARRHLLAARHRALASAVAALRLRATWLSSNNAGPVRGTAHGGCSRRRRPAA